MGFLKEETYLKPWMENEEELEDPWRRRRILDLGALLKIFAKREQ